MSKTTWIEKLENDLSVMRLAPKKFKQEILEYAVIRIYQQKTRKEQMIV